MDTKGKGDIAEQAAILYALKLGWGALKPIGDRLPYDLTFDVSGKLVKIQVKSAWFDKKSRNFIVDIRRTKTNRRKMKRETYKKGDFDFALVYIEPLNLFYVFPFGEFTKYRGQIHLQEYPLRQRSAASRKFRNGWHLIQEWAAPEETQVAKPPKLGEACGVVIPSQAPDKGEGVETKQEAPKD